MTDDRGKRRLAQRVFVAWGAFSLLCLGATVFADLDEHHLGTIEALHWAVTLVSGPLIFGLLGLDAAGAQIIPALKGGIRDDADQGIRRGP